MNKKAFTLTELLVVVMIMGVLASIVLPKFTNVLETRKTTEAEDIMKAVREEQEARCVLGKNYLGPDQREMVSTLPKGEGKHYEYVLQPAGIKADSRSEDYALWIPSYADGRICCSGEYCDQLNKDYPTCEELQAQADFITTNKDCETKSHEPEPTVVPPPAPQPTTCTDPKPAEEEDCECGTRRRTVTCNEQNKWEVGDWDRSDESCNNKAPQISGNCWKDWWCPNGFNYTCDPDTEQWKLDIRGCVAGKERIVGHAVPEERCNSGWLETRIAYRCQDEGWDTYEYVPGGGNCVGNSGFLCEIKCGRPYRYEEKTRTCTCAAIGQEVFNYEPDLWLWGQTPVDERYIDVEWTMAKLPWRGGVWVGISEEKKKEVFEELLEISGQSKEEICEAYIPYRHEDKPDMCKTR